MLEPDMFERETLIDPPSGWRFGFPKPLPKNFKEENFDLRQWFIDNDYPEEEVDFAIHHYRIIGGTIFG